MEDIFVEIDGEQIKLPDGVTDEQIFIDWYRLDKDLKKDSFYESTCGVKINLSAPFKKKTLQRIQSISEQKKVEKIWKGVSKRRGELLVLRNKVFGMISASQTDYAKFFKQNRSEVDYNQHPNDFSTQFDQFSAQIIALFGKFYTLDQVAEILKTEFGLEHFSITSLANFRLRHIENIKEIQEEYKRDYGEIRLTHKKSRLEELNELYFERRIIYNSTKQREDYKLLLQTIEQVKREVEGDIITVNGTIDINVEVTVQSHIHQELLKGLSIKDIIIARVAGRLGVNPAYLISRLHNSFYKKFNGFNIIDENSDIFYPSEVVYDFDKMRELSTTKKTRTTSIRGNTYIR